MEQKKILVTCFGKFHQHKINISQCVSNQLCEMLSHNEVCKLNDNAPLVLNIHGYKKILKQELENNQYDYVISMGLYNFHKKCRLERKLSFGTNNNFLSTNGFKIKNGIGIINLSPCYRIRNYLNKKSKKDKFKWEFIHIPQKYNTDMKKISKIAQTIYAGMINELSNNTANNSDNNS